MSEVKDYPPYLDYPKERRLITNADKIRAMSDEELAQFCCRICDSYYRSHQFWLDWLKQKA